MPFNTSKACSPLRSVSSALLLGLPARRARRLNQPSCKRRKATLALAVRAKACRWRARNSKLLRKY